MQDDPYQYFHHLEHLTLTDEQKIEVIRTIELVMICFIDQAWGIEPTQLALGISAEKRARSALPPVESSQSNQSNFNEAAR